MRITTINVQLSIAWNVHRQFNWINPKTLSTKQRYHRRKIRKSLEIKKAKTNKRRKVLNRDEGNLVKTNTWTPFF